MGAGRTRAGLSRHLFLLVVIQGDRSLAPVPCPPLQTKASRRARFRDPCGHEIQKGQTMTKQQTITADGTIQHIPLKGFIFLI